MRRIVRLTFPIERCQSTDDELFLDPNNYPVLSSSPLVFSPQPTKRSPTTPPLQFYKQSRTDSPMSSAPNHNFSMNNSSY